MNDSQSNRYDSINPRDVIGYYVFNCDSGRGNGKVVELKNIRGEAHFVCEVGDVNSKRVNRPVEQVMKDLREHGYDLCDEPWDVVDAPLSSDGDMEAEIRDRSRESWSKLADEFGIREEDVRDIVVGEA